MASEIKRRGESGQKQREQRSGEGLGRTTGRCRPCRSCLACCPFKPPDQAVIRIHECPDVLESALGEDPFRRGRVWERVGPDWIETSVTILFTLGDSEQSVNNLFPNMREHRLLGMR